jgi:hypothetical protein
MRENARGAARRDEPTAEDPFWLELLIDFAPLGCVLVAGATALTVAYAWASDFFAGHL